MNGFFIEKFERSDMFYKFWELEWKVAWKWILSQI